MKIKVIDSVTKKPLINAKIQLQIKGKDSGYVSLNTDVKGEVTLEEKFKGQQIASALNGSQGPWMTISEGTTLLIPSKQKTTETQTQGDQEGDRK